MATMQREAAPSYDEAVKEDDGSFPEVPSHVPVIINDPPAPSAPVLDQWDDRDSQISTIMERTDCSWDQAERALQITSGDTNMSIIALSEDIPAELSELQVPEVEVVPIDAPLDTPPPDYSYLVETEVIHVEQKLPTESTYPQLPKVTETISRSSPISDNAQIVQSVVRNNPKVTETVSRSSPISDNAQIVQSVVRNNAAAAEEKVDEEEDNDEEEAENTAAPNTLHIHENAPPLTSYDIKMMKQDRVMRNSRAGSTSLGSALMDPKSNVRNEKDFDARLPTACVAEDDISGGGGGGLVQNPDLLSSQRAQREQLLRAHEHQLNRLEKKVNAARAEATALRPPSHQEGNRKKMMNMLSSTMEGMLSGTGAGNVLFGEGQRNSSSGSTSLWKRKLKPYKVIMNNGGGPNYTVKVIMSTNEPEIYVGSANTTEAANALGRSASPPQWQEAKQCVRCGIAFAFLKRKHHCRNCGGSVCDDCSQCRWPSWAMPDLFVTKNQRKSSQRICVACDKEAASFKAAIIAGEVEQAKLEYERGNINLTSPFPFDRVSKEKPIHLAAQSGSIPMLKWLIMEMLVPVSKVESGEGRTAMELAARNLDVDALAWLVRTGACRVDEVKNASVLAAALHACLQMHTLDADTEQYVSSLEVASAEAAGDAGLGVRVGDEATISTPSTSQGIQAQTLVANYMEESDLNQYAVAEVSYAPLPGQSNPEEAVAVVEETIVPGFGSGDYQDASQSNRRRTQTVERSMDL